MGTPGAEQALSVLEHRLQAAGLTPLRVRTTVTVAADRGSWLEVGGKRLAIAPHQSNHAATAGTGGRTISARLVFAGRGTLPELGGKPIAGNIVVLDGDARSGWTTVASLGAAAVVFRRSDGMDGYHLAGQTVAASLVFPRFVADLDPALDGQPALLQSEVAWEPRAASSLIALIPGTGSGREAVVLTAGYEAGGPIDHLTPGATRAWNAALLAELAVALAKAPPQRSVLVVFNGGRAEYFRGLRQVMGALTLDRQSDRGLSPANRIVDLLGDAEAARSRTMLVADTLAAVDPAGAGLAEALRRGLRQRIPAGADAAEQGRQAQLLLELVLANEAGDRADVLLEGVDHLRERQAELRRGGSADALAQVRSELAKEEPVYQRWRSLQQRLDYGKDLDEDGDRALGELLPAARALVARHRSVVDDRAADLRSLAAARALAAKLDPIHLVALDFSDGNDAFSTATGGFFVTWSNDLSWLHKAVLKLATGGALRSAYDPAPQQLPADSGAFFPAEWMHEAGAVGNFLPAVTFATTNDARLRVGTPLDTAAAFRAGAFLHQCAGLLPLLSAYIDCPDIADRKPKTLVFKQPLIGVEARATGSKNGRRPFPFALSTMVFGWRSDLVGDVRAWETEWGDLAGNAQVLFESEFSPGMGHGLPLTIYGCDARGGITHVIASGGQQKTNPGLELGINQKLEDKLVLLFRAVPSRLHGAFDPRLLTELGAVTPLSAYRNAQPNFYHCEAADGQIAVFTEPDVPLLVTASQGRVGNRLVLLGEPGAKAGDYAGRGAGGALARLTPLDAAEDMWHLDEQRLALLRHSGIEPDSLVTLHAAAERQLTLARQAWQRGDIAGASGAAQASWALTSRVYPNLLATANDVVYGLVVLLFFAIPFALICERLFLAGGTVVRKVAGFAGCFTAVFLFFLCFHPAFSLATTPMIIFLAFVIILMSMWVIGIIAARFEQEMETIRMAGEGHHRADVSRLGVLLATVALGTSNMRRRPLRTALTAATVVLMTFILLTFAGFNPVNGTQRIALDAPAPYQGVLLRFNGWSALPEPTLERMESSWGTQLVAYPLRWLQPSTEVPKFPLSGPGGTSQVTGVVGVRAGRPHRHRDRAAARPRRGRHAARLRQRGRLAVPARGDPAPHRRAAGREAALPRPRDDGRADRRARPGRRHPARRRGPDAARPRGPRAGPGRRPGQQRERRRAERREQLGACTSAPRRWRWRAPRPSPGWAARCAPSAWCRATPASTSPTSPTTSRSRSRPPCASATRARATC